MDQHSTIEQLPDPTGAPDRSNPARRELWLGVILVVGVLVFATGDWRHQEDQARAYAEGATATLTAQWDSAASIFGGLGAYRDAPARAQAAATQVARRDTSYQAGVDAAARADWPAAAVALSTTLAVAPSYRDAAARYDAATTALVTTALSQMIVRRSDSTESGLYVGVPGGGTVWMLPDSDSLSQVHAADAATGHIVYDVNSPTSPPHRRIPPPFRQLRLAAIGPQGVRATALPVWLESEVRVVLGHDGVWWAITDRTPNLASSLVEQPTPALPALIEGYVNTTLSYQAWSATDSVSVKLPGPTWGVLDIDPAGRLLLGQFEGLAGAGVPHTRLYLAGPTGADPRPIALTGGLVHRATFSPDGRFVLYTNYETRDRGQVVQRAALVVIDLQADPPTEQTVGSVTVAYGSEAVPVAGVFLPGAPTARLLVKLSNGLSASFGVRDLLTGQQLRLWEEPTHPAARYWLPSDGQTLLTPAGDPDHPRYRLQPLNILQPRPPLDLPTPPGAPGDTVLDLAIQGALAIYTLGAVDKAGNLTAQSVYSVAMQGDRPPLLLTHELSAAQPDGPQHLLLPGGLLASITPNATLYLQTLDATFDAPLIPAVDAIWPFGVSSSQTWQP